MGHEALTDPQASDQLVVDAHARTPSAPAQTETPLARSHHTHADAATLASVAAADHDEADDGRWRPVRATMGVGQAGRLGRWEMSDRVQIEVVHRGAASSRCG